MDQAYFLPIQIEINFILLHDSASGQIPRNRQHSGRCTSGRTTHTLDGVVGAVLRVELSALPLNIGASGPERAAQCPGRDTNPHRVRRPALRLRKRTVPLRARPKSSSGATCHPRGCRRAGLESETNTPQTVSWPPYGSLASWITDVQKTSSLTASQVELRDRPKWLEKTRINRRIEGRICYSVTGQRSGLWFWWPRENKGDNNRGASPLFSLDIDSVPYSRRFSNK
jgi:hypothetical protein